MDARHNRIAALLSAVVLAALVLAGAGSADAATSPHGAPSEAAAKVCVKPPPRNDDSIHVIGCLTDTRESPPAPVSGVKISVEDDAGKVVGNGTSNQTGIFDIPLPGKSIDILGNTYVIKIDKASLPKGAALRDPKKVELKQQISLDSDVYIAFPIGPLLDDQTGKLTQGLQLLVGGIVFSLLLAMAALGLSMIFGTTGLTNFAHGELVTFGALIAYGFDLLPGTVHLGGANLTIFVAIFAAAVGGGIFGWAMDTVLWRPLRHRGTGLIAMMVVSIGLSIFLRSLFQYVAGGDTHQYSQFSTPSPWHIGPILVTPKDVGVAAFSAVVLVLVVLALQRTRMGKATRAVADNPALAASSGINVDRVISVVWIGGAALAGLSGVLLGMTQGFDFQIGFKILLLVFAAVTLGGLGTAWGAIVGAFIIGTFIEVSTLFVPPELKFVGALVVLILVLLVRPQGLLGKAQRVG
jgi:branched-subunit amino acid ABC-type transport system permease component